MSLVHSNLPSLPPAELLDPVIEAYKKDVDRTILRENLKLTPQQCSDKFVRAMHLVFELRRSGAERRFREKERK